MSNKTTRLDDWAFHHLQQMETADIVEELKRQVTGMLSNDPKEKMACGPKAYQLINEIERRLNEYKNGRGVPPKNTEKDVVAQGNFD